MYESERLRGKPEWQAAEMLVHPPKIQQFLPKDGIHPVPFEMCHGKMLLKALGDALHQRIGGNSKDIKTRILRPSPTVREPAWAAAFAT